MASVIGDAEAAMHVRALSDGDAKGFIELLEQLDRESKLMLFEPGERVMNEAAQRERIAAMQKSETQVVFAAEVAGRLVGFLGSTVGGQRRSCHTASLVVGVLQDFHGRGIGSALLEALDGWARSKQLHRLELTVMTHNERALRLYQKHGFVVEGTRVDSLRVDGAFVHEHYLGKIID